MTGTNAKWPKRLAAAAVFLGVVLAAVLWVNHLRVGRVLDIYRAVPVYDNGLLFFRSYGRHYSAEGYYYGQKWQCVEFVKRFYCQAKGHKMPDVWGHARDYFDPALPDGALNARRDLVQYRNGSSTKPQPDDLLVFADTRFGHVAIVTDVAGDSLEVVQQNILGRTRQRFALMSSNRCWVVTAPRRPSGWLRLPQGRDPETRTWGQENGSEFRPRSQPPLRSVARPPGQALIGIRASDFLRPSDFGLRNSPPRALARLQSDGFSSLHVAAIPPLTSTHAMI